MPGNVLTAAANASRAHAKTAGQDALSDPLAGGLTDPLGSKATGQAAADKANKPDTKTITTKLGGIRQFGEPAYQAIGGILETMAPADGSGVAANVALEIPVEWVTIQAGLRFDATRKADEQNRSGLEASMGAKFGVGFGINHPSKGKALAGIQLEGSSKARGDTGYETAVFLGAGIEEYFRGAAGWITWPMLAQALGLHVIAAGMVTWDLFAAQFGLETSTDKMKELTGGITPADALANVIFEGTGARAKELLSAGEFIENSARVAAFAEASAKGEKDFEGGIAGDAGMTLTERTTGDGKGNTLKTHHTKWGGQVTVTAGPVSGKVEVDGTALKLAVKGKMHLHDAETAFGLAVVQGLANMAKIAVAENRSSDASAIAALQSTLRTEGQGAFAAAMAHQAHAHPKGPVKMEQALELEFEADSAAGHGEVALYAEQEAVAEAGVAKAALAIKERLYQNKFHMGGAHAAQPGGHGGGH